MALGNRLRIDVYDGSGVLQSAGPLFRATGFAYTLTMDRIGSFQLDLPATDTRATLFQQGYEIRCYFEGEGLVFRGIVDRASYSVQASGQIGLTVTGGTVGRQLVFANSLLNNSYNLVTLASFMSTILSGTGWTAGTLSVPTTNLLARFDGVAVSDCIDKAAQQFRYHWRENILTKTVDVGPFGTNPNNLYFQNIQEMSPAMAAANTTLFPISRINPSEESQDMWNKIIALGAGDGVNQLTLRYSDRTTAGGFPYNVSSATGPDGALYYFITDATSAAAYQTRTRVVSVKEAIPLANSAAGFTAAANALYDVAATYLQRHKDPQKVYEVDVENLRNLDAAGNPLFRVGDKVNLRYNGWSTNPATGARSAWLTVNAAVTILEMTRQFKQDGSWDWKLKLSTVDRLQDTIDQKLATVFNNVFALNVSPSPYTYREIHNMTRVSVDGSHTAVMTANFDANIAYMHQAKLQFKIQALRSNVSTAASGGGQTSGTGLAHSHTVNAQTSGTGLAHNHTINATTATAGGSHRHQMFNVVTNPTMNTGGPSVASTQAESADHTHLENGAGLQTGTDSVTHTHSLNSHTHTVQLESYSAQDSTGALITMWLPQGPFANMWTYETVADHTHAVTAPTSVNESTHTHSVAASTSAQESLHTHNVAAHTHPITYAIQDQASPINPGLAVTVNGTAITGSPFNTVGSDIVVDVSAQIQNGIGQIASANNTIVFTSPSQLFDVEATLRSLVTATSLVPV